MKAGRRGGIEEERRRGVEVREEVLRESWGKG